MESTKKETSIIIGEKLSNRYYARKTHLRNKTIPTLAEIKKSVRSLESIFHRQLPQDTQEAIGYEPKLIGPSEPLWIPPNSDFSKQRKLFPVSIDYIKALTHNGVMGIGDKVFQYTEERYQRSLKNALSENDALWKWTVKHECKKSVKQAVKKERSIHEKNIDNIIAEYSKIHNVVIKTMENQYSTQLLINIEETNHQLKNHLKEETENALSEQKHNLESEFEKKIVIEKAKLTGQFKTLLEQQYARFGKELHDRSQTLRHQLECRGIADVLYAACSERHHYLIKQSQAEKYFQRKYNELAMQLALCEKQLEDTNLKYKRTMQNEQKLKENIDILCKMMRKFMSYQFNVPPSQLGFLPIFENLYIDNTVDKESSSTNIQDAQIVTGAKKQEKGNKGEKSFHSKRFFLGSKLWKGGENLGKAEKKAISVYENLSECSVFSKNIHENSASLKGMIPKLGLELSISSESKEEKKIEYEDDILFKKIFKIESNMRGQKSSKSMMIIHHDSATSLKDQRVVTDETDITDVVELSIPNNILENELPPYMTYKGVDGVQHIDKYHKEKSITSLIDTDEAGVWPKLDLKIPSVDFTQKMVEKKAKVEEDIDCQYQLHSQTFCINSTDSGKERKDSVPRYSLMAKGCLKVIADNESWKHLEKNPEQFTKYTQETLQEAIKRNPSLIHCFKEKRIM